MRQAKEGSAMTVRVSRLEGTVIDAAMRLAKCGRAATVLDIADDTGLYVDTVRAVLPPFERLGIVRVERLGKAARQEIVHVAPSVRWGVGARLLHGYLA
jgi:predicted transcriptional regulator